MQKEPEEPLQEDDPAVYRRANRFLQIGLAVGIVILVMAQAGAINFDYGFYACVISVAIGAGIRQIIVARNS